MKRNDRIRVDLDEHFEPIQTILKWVGYAMFTAAGLALLFAGAWWAILHWKAVLTVTSMTVAWLVVYLALGGK